MTQNRQNTALEVLEAVHKMASPISDENIGMFGEPVELTVIEGKSISQILVQCNWGVLLSPNVSNGRVYLNDILLPRDKWDSIYPMNRDTIHVGIIPSGGGGDSNKVLRSVAMIGVMAFAAWAGPAAGAAIFGEGAAGAIAGGVIAGGIGIAGALGVNALIPMPTAPYADNQVYGTNSYTSLLGINNVMKPYAPIQKLFGNHKIFPPYAVKPFTEVQGENIYGNYVFAVGPGDYLTENHKIGDTLLTSYSDYTIQEGYRNHISIFNRGDIDETDLSIELTHAGGPFIQTTAPNTNEISVDLSSTGLYGVTDGSGKVVGRTIDFTLEYSITGLNSWTTFGGTGDVYRKKQEQFWVNFKVTDLPSNTYDVRITRNTADDPSPTGVSGYAYATSTFYWTKLRSISYTDPFTLDNIYLIALRIRLDGQVSGSGVNTFNLEATSKLESYNGSSWDAAAATRNPAWVYCSVLRDFSNRKAISDSELIPGDFKDWADDCDANGYYFDGIIEDQTKVFDILREIAAVGRAKPTRTRQGKYTIVRDTDQTVRTQKITPINSWDFGGRKLFEDIPHALRCRFINRDKDFTQDEGIVYQDGYDENTATIFEVVDFKYVTTWDHVWHLARFHLGQALYRPEVFNVSMDFEHMANDTDIGSLVGFSYDAILVGLGSALVTAVNLDGSNNCISVKMNNSIVMEAGKTYGASIRRTSDGRMISASIVLNVGQQTTISFSPSIPAADVPSVGDLINYGETGLIELDCLIQAMRPLNDSDVVLTLVEDAPEARAYADGTAPGFTSKISHPAVQNEIPFAPTIEGVSISSRLNTIGSLNKQLQLVAAVVFSLDTSTGVPVQGYQCEYHDQEDVDGGWERLPALLNPFSRYFPVDVENGVTYDFRIRSVSQYGEVSEWSTLTDYTVDYFTIVPLAITGLDLIPSGSVWTGLDCSIQWTTPSDIWNVAKVKVEIYKTSSLSLIRTEYFPPDQNVYSFKYTDNVNLNSGTPIGGLTFRVSALNLSEEEGTYGEKAVTHSTPTNVANLTSHATLGGVVFTWDANTDDAFSHFEYRMKIATGTWSNWQRTSNTELTRQLTQTEKSSYGQTATIYLEIKAIDFFTISSSTASASRAAGSLYIEAADVASIGPFASSMFPYAPIVLNLSVVNNSNNGVEGSASGYIYWSAFIIWHNEVQYNISSGYTNLKYVVFKDLSNTLQFTNTVPADNWANWTPKEDFVILYNQSGTGMKAWETLTNAIIGSANIADLAVTNAKIADLAVTNAKINDLDASKITTGFLDAARIQATSIVVSKLASDATERMFTSSTKDFSEIGGATKPADNATVGADWDTNLSNKPSELYQYYFQVSEPVVGVQTGDYWVRNGDFHLFRYSGTAWVEIRDNGIAAAATAASNAQSTANTALSTANSKIKSYYQTSAPTSGMVTGDLWFDTNDAFKVYRYDGYSWLTVRDSGIAQAISDAAGAQATADGKVTTFIQASAPTAEADGDLWLDSDDNYKMYRWNGSTWDNVAYDVATWSKVIGTGKPADNATKNNIYRQSAQPTGQAGDLWEDIDDGKLYRHSGTAWELIGTEDSGWRHASDGTKIDGGKIYADSITATQISVATLSALTANLGTCTAGLIKSSDGRIQLDLNNKWLKVWDGSSVLRVHIGYIP